MTGITVAAFALSTSLALAQENPVSNAGLLSKPEAIRADVTDVRKEAQERAKAAREEAQERVKAVREEAQERVKTMREEAQERVKALRENTDRRLAELRDKKKQEAARKLAARLEDLNKTWTDHFAKLLDRYGAMIEKMQKRADTAAADGKDVTAARAAIQTAQDAVATAKTAVAAQAAKAYALDASTATGVVATTTPADQDELLKALKSSFQSLHRTLFTDLYALRDGAMKAARRAVQDALQTLGKVPDVDKGTATSTASSNNP